MNCDIPSVAKPTELNRRQQFFNRLQQYLPQQLLSRLMYHACRWRWRLWKNAQIRWFIKRYNVNLQEAELTSVDSYPHFNAFFTRALHSDSRPIVDDDNCVLAPVDGCISQIGAIRDTTLIQAKGHDYTVTDLLAGDQELTKCFRHGSFATLYLSPRDYHRIHMPCDGRLQRMIHVPGRRFAVNTTSVAGVANLFARNERLVNIFETASGPLALIMVGAMFVGSMETVWADALPARGRGECSDYDYRNARVHLRRGAEMGRFNMGSTVILLFGRDQVEWLTGLDHNQQLRCGQEIGRFVDLNQISAYPARQSDGWISRQAQSAMNNESALNQN